VYEKQGGLTGAVSCGKTLRWKKKIKVRKRKKSGNCNRQKKGAFKKQ